VGRAVVQEGVAMCVDGARVQLVLRTLRGAEQMITVGDETPLFTVRERAAAMLKIDFEEATLVAFGRRLGEEGSEEDSTDRGVETVGDLAWAPLGAVDPCVRDRHAMQ
jgi:hypothetical protein